MSNRFLGFLLLLGVPAFFYLIYLIFFVSFTGTLVIASNVSNFEVSLYAKSYAKEFNYKCSETPCTLKDVSPLNYNITIKSPTYKDYVSEIKVGARKTITIDVPLVKDTKLNEITNKQTKVIDNKTKIDEIKLKKQSYWFTSLDLLGYFYFKENGNNLELYRNFENEDKKLGDFPRVKVEDISLGEVYGAKNTIYISLSEDKYIYDLASLSVDSFKLVPKLNYIKAGDSLTSFLVNTDKGTFTFNKADKTLEYFYLFRDFVYYGEDYIGVIYSDEKSKLDNFGIKSEGKNIIVKYNSKTLKRNVILETDNSVSKILLEGNDVFFYDKNGKKYKLENI